MKNIMSEYIDNPSEFPRMLSATDPDLIAFMNRMTGVHEFLLKMEEEEKEKDFLPYFIGIKDLAKRLDLSTRTIIDYKDKGILPFIKIGGTVLFPVDKINEVLRNSTHLTKNENE